MGLKPTKYRSAAEALLRRFKRENDLPRFHPVVDICNAISIAFALPVAIFDLDKIEEFLEVCFAKGTEKYLAFSEKIELPSPGEIIFRDASNQVHARRWTFRQSRLSVVNPDTSRILIISEGLHNTASFDIPEVINSLARTLSNLGLSTICQAVLTAKTPCVDFLR